MIIPQYELIETIRKRAKSDYWQSLYSQAKEVAGMHIFRNTSDFTELQVLFLNKLAFYNCLYFDIAMGEVTDIVMDNEIYEDAYAYYREEQRGKKKKKKVTTPVVHQTPNLAKDEYIVQRNEFVFTKTKDGIKKK